MKGFKDSYIYVDGKGVVKTSLSICDGRISAIGEDVPDGIVLADNHILVPGFIDEHIHGCHGHDVMEANKDSLLDMAKQLAQEGVAYFCPTTMSMSIDDIKKALQVIADVKATTYEGAEIIGVHLEGPFLSKKYHGAQNEKYIIPGNREILKQFLDASGEQIRLLTFAYENDGDNILPMMKHHHITPSLGHSDASAEVSIHAFNEGVSCVTHCFNAMRGIHHRDVGVVGASMLKDEVMCELIADLKHVSKEAIQLLFKVKGPEKIILVSDAIEAKYLPDGAYALGGQKVIVKDGAARLEDGTLAGSVLRLDQALKNIRAMMPHLTFTQIIDLVSKNPAKNLRISDIGTIAVGQKARFTVVDKAFNIIKTYA